MQFCTLSHQYSCWINTKRKRNVGRESRVGERGARENSMYQVPTINSMLKRTVSHASALCALQPCLMVNIDKNGIKELYMLAAKDKTESPWQESFFSNYAWEYKHGELERLSQHTRIHWCIQDTQLSLSAKCASPWETKQKHQEGDELFALIWKVMSSCAWLFPKGMTSISVLFWMLGFKLQDCNRG